MKTRGLLTFVNMFGTLGIEDAVIETEIIFLHVTSVESLLSIHDLLLSPLSGLDGIEGLIEEYGETIIDYIIDNNQTKLIQFLKLHLPQSTIEEIKESVTNLLKWKTALLLDRFSQLVSIADNIGDSYDSKKRLVSGEKLPKVVNINEFFVVPHNYSLVYKEVIVDEEKLPSLPDALNTLRYAVKLKMTFLRDDLTTDNNIFNLFPQFIGLKPFTFNGSSVYSIHHDKENAEYLVGFGDWFFNNLTHYKTYITGFGFAPSMLYCLPKIQNPATGEGRFVYFDDVIYTDNTGVPYTIRNTYKSNITETQGLAVSLGSTYPYREDLLYNYNSGGDYVSHEYAYYSSKFKKIEKCYIPETKDSYSSVVNPVTSIIIQRILTSTIQAPACQNGLAWLHGRLTLGDNKLTFSRKE